MAQKKSTSLVARLSATLLLSLIGFAVFCFVYTFTNGMSSGFKSFYVLYDNQTILQSASVVLPFDEESRFDVGYTFGFMNQYKDKGYGLTIVPHTDENSSFTYLRDGEPSIYNYERELTSCFNLTIKESYFIIKMDKDMQEILQSLYPHSTIELPDRNFYNVYYFNLIITSYDKTSSIQIKFGYSPTEERNE